jgi:hypothetical protein
MWYDSPSQRHQTMSLLLQPYQRFGGQSITDTKVYHPSKAQTREYEFSYFPLVPLDHRSTVASKKPSLVFPDRSTRRSLIPGVMPLLGDLSRLAISGKLFIISNPYAALQRFRWTGLSRVLPYLLAYKPPYVARARQMTYSR